MFHRIFYMLMILATLSIQKIVGEYEEDTWIEPNAWGRDVPGWKDNVLKDHLNSCPVCPSDRAALEDGVALVYYKKFITNLFHRQKLVFNKDALHYQRSLRFTLLPDQLEKLEQLSDPRDLDGVLTEIIATARTIDMFGSNVDSSMGITAIVLDILKDSFELLKISEIQFTLIVVAAILLCWFLHNRYQIGYIRMGFISFFLFGFFFTYLECNRKLEIDEILEYITVEPGAPSWYSSLFFWRSNENVEVKQLKKSRNLKMRFCRPDHVLIMYINDLFMKQLESLIEKFTATTSSFTSNLPFPYNLMAPILLFSFIGYIFKLTYKYILSPRAWASLLHLNQHSQNPHAQQQSSPHNAIHVIAEDRISGENLKLLLSAIKTPNLLIKNDSSAVTPAVSGVQEVLEQIEAKPNSPKKPLEPMVDNNNSTQSKETDVEVLNILLKESKDPADEHDNLKKDN